MARSKAVGTVCRPLQKFPAEFRLEPGEYEITLKGNHLRDGYFSSENLSHMNFWAPGEVSMIVTKRELRKR